MIKRLFKMIKYTSKIEPLYILGKVLVHTINGIKPFLIFVLSKVVLDGVMTKTPANELIMQSCIMLGVFFVLSVIVGFFQKRDGMHRKMFFTRHGMNKAMHILNLGHGFSEKNETQSNLVALKQLERFRVFSPSDFLEKFGMLVGGFISSAVAVYFCIGLFDNSGFWVLSGPIVNIGFIVLIIGLNLMVFFVTRKIYEDFGKHISVDVNRDHRYLGSYPNLIYDYKVGKDIRIYDGDLARAFSDRYQKVLKVSHDFLGNFFTKSVTFKRVVEGIIATLIFLFITVKIASGTIALSEGFMYIGIINLFCSQLSFFMEGISVLVSSDEYRKKLFDFLDLENEEEEGSIIPTENINNVFEFKNVSFKYPDTDRMVLKNINLRLEPGKKLALVGKNGSGKTTLIKLISRLYQPTEGEILLNGKNINEYDKAEYRKIFSVVFQDFKLFSLTLAENIAIGEDYDSKKIADSLEKVGMKEFYDKHGDNIYLYQNFDNSGIEVSGGEAQKIAMARAIYNSGKFYILDEPTAALDPISESEIYEHFDSITSGNTAIYISHRLSSCKFCDTIVVMNEGETVQSGTHQELVSSDGLYKELWDAQAKHYV